MLFLWSEVSSRLSILWGNALVQITYLINYPSLYHDKFFSNVLTSHLVPSLGGNFNYFLWPIHCITDDIVTMHGWEYLGISIQFSSSDSESYNLMMKRLYFYEWVSAFFSWSNYWPKSQLNNRLKIFVCGCRIFHVCKMKHLRIHFQPPQLLNVSMLKG